MVENDRTTAAAFAAITNPNPNQNFANPTYRTDPNRTRMSPQKR